MIVQKKCPHFFHQEDRNGEMVISFCNAMKEPEQDHEGNDYSYPCPLGLQKKVCYEVLSLGSDKPKPPTNADRIRGMSDEELAKEIQLIRAGALNEYFEAIGVGIIVNGHAADYQQTLHWLCQPAKEDA